jgi:hypothetical protein
MTDLTAERLPDIKAQRITGLDLGQDFIYPKYDGSSILNIPMSICQLLGVPGLGGSGLAPEILAPLGDGIHRLIVILMDGLALHRLQRWMDDGTSPIWKNLAREGVLAPLTSVSPSTTSSAITSLWTGRSPKEHGIVGYELWLKEYGVVANMILHSPMSYKDETGSLEKAGFEAENYLQCQTLGTHLQAHGIQPFVFQHHSIIHSGLSKMILKDVQFRPVGTPADLWIGVRQWIEHQSDQPNYIWVYWSELDHLSHFYGPDDERPEAEFTIFSQAFENLFLKRLSHTLRRDTAVILTSDHGQVATPKDPRYDLRNHPELNRYLHIAPTGENRLIYLYVRPGRIEDIQAYIERAWPGDFKVLKAAYIAKSNLFGPGEAHPELRNRLGDLVLVPQGNHYLWWNDRKPNPLLGRHGGFHVEEMLVPFLAARL